MIPRDLLDMALRVASQAALDAGAMLREEFHRPDGARGDGDSHADIDEQAECMIRARLLGAFPGWAFEGEETGSEGPDSAPARWLVDPNDGTRTFLKGLRGSSVSIGLLSEGLPVLGVVFAPLSPDDRGDMIAWAEGQPLTRNGAPCHPPARGPLDRMDIVLVSHKLDSRTAGCLALTAPARMVARPSIAYRLALAAVGDAAAAVSLDGPNGWDIAGGHALLRAAGCDVVDEAGRPIRYHGRVKTVLAFGGGDEATAALAGRDWAGVRASPPDVDDEDLPVARPAPGEHITDAALLARAQGCLLGQVAGDALGAMVEFQSVVRIRSLRGGVQMTDGGPWNIIAGQPTDDSEMALALARSILRTGEYNASAARTGYVRWFESGPFDCGSTTRAGLTGHPFGASQANGSLMRASPLAVFGHAMPPDRLAGLVRQDSAITHPNHVCRDACAAFCIGAAHAIRTGDASGAWQAALSWAQADAVEEVVAALESALTPPRDFGGATAGWVLVALKNAFHRLLASPGLESGVRDTVMEGGDSDTNAAIAGALLGAVYGRDAVPAEWRGRVMSCRTHQAYGGVRRPRPRPFWPVDLYELAEGLLVAGRLQRG